MKRTAFTISIIAASICLSFTERALSATDETERGKTADDVMLNANSLDTPRATALRKLFAGRATGLPLAIQEIEVLDALDSGLSIASIEADVVASRALYDAYVAGKPLSKEQQDVLNRYRDYNAEHAQDLVARNAVMNADHPDAKGTSTPDNSRDWELYSDPQLFNQLSSGYQRRLEAKFGHKGKVREAGSGGQASKSPDVPDVANTLVNNPSADTTTRDTQSETAIILGAGTTVLSSFNDSGSNIGGANHFTGIARSIDSGATWTDQGTLPASANGDAGDPVYARSASTGTAILATLGFTSGAVLEIFRTLDNGATYTAPVNGAAGGGSLDKEWVASDKFAGAGLGNFYLFFRDFAAGGGMTFTRSLDDGVTWGSRQILASASGQGAWVVVGADHAVYCFWLAGTQLVFRKSTDFGVTFGAQTTVTALRTTGSNGDLGLNGGFRTNAFMQVVAHPTTAGQLIAVWNDKGISPSTDKANIYLSQTTNGGATWSAPVQVNTDATTNDQWQPVLAITPDGTGLFTSWYDRRLDGANSLIDVFGRNAAISGATITFASDYRITDTSFPVVIGQDSAIVATYMGDYDSAVADNSMYYRTWGDNRLPLGTHARQPDVRFTSVPKSQGTGPSLSAAGATLVSEGCTPANGVPDPNEVVTISFGVMNVGNASTTNVVGTLQATGGVTSPSGPQNYGAIAPGATVSRNFSFTVTGTCGGTITATLQLQDGATNFGTVTYTFTLGALSTSFSQNFDGVVAPALPPGWTATNAVNPDAIFWVTSTTTPDTAPNDAFVNDPGVVSDKYLDSAPISIASAGTLLSFRNNYLTEATYDGGVLEVSSPNINGGTFTDVTSAAVGGTFVAGGYNATISTAFMSPIAGRQAWSGNSGGYITTTVNLGPNVVGQTIKLRFRMASDSSVAVTGWRVDTITLSQRVCATSCGSPIPSSAVSRKTHAGAGTFDIPLALTDPAGIECRSGGATNDYTMVVTFGGAVTVTGTPQAQVTLGAGQVGSGGFGNGGAVSVSGAAVTIPLTNVTNVQVINVTLFGVNVAGGSTGNVVIPMKVLVGDVNASSSVSAADVASVKSQSGLPVTSANFRTDVNANGAVNAADVALVKSQSGTGLP